MKVLFCGDAVVSTGFARCTHAACDALHAAGHDVSVVGINYWGSPHTYPYPIYPSVDPTDGGRDKFGVGRTAILAKRLQPDIVVLLNDPWNVKAYLDALEQVKYRGRVVAWLAVDSKNNDGKPLNRLDAVVTWTVFGSRELAAGGCTRPSYVCPLGVDTSIFFPHSKVESRRTLKLPQDTFLVTAVGRNQPRKRLDLTISYFADWIRRYDISDAALLLHVAPTGDLGVDIRSMVRYYGLANRVILNAPNIGHGEDNSTLALIYAASDVYLSTSQAEGWGLPALEAMACGCACIVPDFAAFSSPHKDGGWITDGAAIQVPCTSIAPTAPMNSLMHTIGGVPDRAATVFALNIFHKQPAKRDLYVAEGLRLAESLPWHRTGTTFCEILEEVSRQAPLPASPGTQVGTAGTAGPTGTEVATEVAP